MAKTIQFKRGTTAQVNAFVGALGEVVVDTDKDVIVVHDGVTAGGFPAAARANTDGSVSILSKTGSSLAEIPSSGLINTTLTSSSNLQALAASQGKFLKDTKLDIAAALGHNQGWSDFTGIRAVGTTYTNSTGSPILVLVRAEGYNTTTTVLCTLDSSITIPFASDNSGAYPNAVGSVIIPVGSTYSITVTGGGLIGWWELR